MKRFLANAARWFSMGFEARRTPKADGTKVHLHFDGLESREVPSVYYNNGSLLANVQVENAFYGQDFYYNSTFHQDAVALTNVMGDMTQSSYMPMLGEYGIGNGQLNGAVINYGYPSGYSVLDDAQIQQMIDAGIYSGNFVAPSPNQLYVVYTEANVIVTLGNQSSQRDFAGYHNTFYDPNLGSIYYAVIDNPIGNWDVPGLNWVQQQTVASSHELTEAITDPDTVSGWRDYYNTGGEIGDLCEGIPYFGILDGYVVQSEWLNSINNCAIPYNAQWYNPFGSPHASGSGSLSSKGQGTANIDIAGLADPSLAVSLDNDIWNAFAIPVTALDVTSTVTHHAGANSTALSAASGIDEESGSRVSMVISDLSNDAVAELARLQVSQTQRHGLEALTPDSLAGSLLSAPRSLDIVFVN